MQVLVIRNQGVMDIEAITMMGLSTKQDDNTKIGMFGTGNKYAIAVLMREGYELSIVTPKWKGNFKTDKKVFRGHDYHAITLTADKKKIELGITTQMGLQWDLDSALREFICNAKDEGDMGIQLFSSESKAKDYYKNYSGTAIIISSNKKDNYLANYIKNFDSKYLFNRDPVYIDSTEVAAIYQKLNPSDPLRVYRNGVLIYQENIPSLFDYELNKCEITEARTTNAWQAQYEFGKIIFNLPNKWFNTICENVSDEHFEARSQYYNPLLTSKFPDALIQKTVLTREIYKQAPHKFFSQDILFVPNNWYSYLRGQPCVKTAHKVLGETELKPGKEYTFEELNNVEQQIMTAAIAFVRNAGYSLSESEIIYKELESKGQFSNNKIYISKEFISRGIYDTTNTLIHEIMHRESKQGDYTFQFQEHLVHEIVKQCMLRLNIAL